MVGRVWTLRGVAVLTVAAAGALSTPGASRVLAQGAARAVKPAPARAARPAGGPSATVNQLMRGILFPSSNAVFFAQTEDPAAVTPDREGSRSTNLLTSVLGKWEGVENCALALAESADLLMAPGRLCSNGRPAPVQDPEWRAFVQELRTASLAAYAAAKAKNLDAMLEVSGDLTETCSHCHGTYREAMGRGVSPNRCLSQPGRR